MAHVETPIKTLQRDDVQKSEWRFICRPEGVSIRPDMRMAEHDGIQSWEVVIAPERIDEVIDILIAIAEQYEGNPE